MPEQGVFITELVLVLGAVLIGGIVAHRLRLPLMVGYLAAGILIGPYTPGAIADLQRVQVLADLGVAFLMFTLGVQISLPQLLAVRRVGIFGGLLQIALTMLLGVVLGSALGWPLPHGLFLGAIAALSSSAVTLRLLSERGELNTLHAQLAIAISVLQDLSVIPLIIILPALAAPATNPLQTLVLALVKAVVLLAATILLGTRVVPRLLYYVAATRSRELFLLTIVGLALGTAVAAQAMGLSLAFGAFLAGLIISESAFGRQVLAEILPLHDIFAALFFVSVGMLFNPLFLLQHLDLVLLFTIVVVLGKFLITAPLPVLFGYPLRAGLWTGLFLAQIGEFSFILARVGVERGAIGADLYTLTIAGALLSILLNPLLIAGAPLLRPLGRHPWLARWLAEPLVLYAAEPERLVNHVVLCGYGKIGAELATVLQHRGFPFIVVEINPDTVQRLRKEGIPCLYGDAGNPAVLEHTNLRRARALVLTIPDPLAAERAVLYARQHYPRLFVVARAHNEEELRRLRQAGAQAVVYPELEAALEFVRHTLRRYGISGPELQAILSGRRVEFYGETGAP